MTLSIIKKCLVTTLLVCSIFTNAYANYDFSSWPFFRNIDTTHNSGMVKLTLPNDISWVGSDFDDIRIIDDRGGEVPYLITRSMNTSSHMISARLLDMSTQQDGATRFIVDTGRSGIVQTMIELISLSSNFRRQVSLYASNMLIGLDDAGWSLVTRDGYIFKFTDPYSGFTSGKGTINFSPNTSRYFKVVISGGEEGPVNVQNVSVANDISVDRKSYSQDFSVSTYNNPTKKTTEIVIDLGFIGRISQEITLNTTDTNYNRRVIIEGSNILQATSSWKYISEGSISRISTTLFQGFSNTIRYPEQRFRYIRVSVVNDDNPPLTVIPKVAVVGPVLSLIFEAQSDKVYSLYYGSVSAKKPNYDIVRLSSYIEEASLPMVNVGLEKSNPDYIPPKVPVAPFTESNKDILDIFLVLVVLVIGGGIALYLIKYIKHNKDENVNKNESGFVTDENDSVH